MDGGSNPRTLPTSPHSITHTRTHTLIPPGTLMPEVQALPTKAHASTTCYHGNEGGAGGDLSLPFSSLHTSISLVISGAGVQEEIETRIKVAGGMLYTAILPFKLLHPSFSFSFCIFLSLLPSLPPSFPVSVCPLRREEGRGVSRGAPPEHTPLECRATVITGLHFSLCSGRLIHTHHASQLQSFHLRPWP